MKAAQPAARTTAFAGIRFSVAGFTAPASLVLFGLILIALFVMTGCTAKNAQNNDPMAMVARTLDDHSWARPQEARVKNVDLDLTADFAKKTLEGTATLTLVTEANAKQVILDTRALDIQDVTDAAGAPLKYTLGKGNEIMGRPLTIELPQGAQTVVVRYATEAGGTALQWLDPAQTAGKKLPFLFSQGEEINTRSWIPTQDSPAIRQTYTARIVVPSNLVAVMGGDRLTPKGEPVDGHPSLRAFRFDMDKPVAPYLIALAIGDIGFKSEGRNTGVYAERAVLDKAAYEFADMQAMLDAAEKLYGPYPWGRYDVLVLPPSFPYGGMENPTLTFVTPTVLTGDRSLVSVVAHELAHSWSGNLVSNATWEDFWLNEGFTTYAENRIMEAVYGKDRADMQRVLGWQDLQATLKELSESNHGDFTRLHPDLSGVNPEDYVSDIPYQKGAAFLRMLEAHFGRARLDAYLKGYFQRYAFHSMTTDAFVVDLRENLLHNDANLEKSLKIRQWLYDKGLPDNAVAPTSRLLDQVKAQADAFMNGTAPDDLVTTDWTSPQWQYFLTQLPDTLSLDQMAALDKAFAFTESHNDDILFDWLMLAVQHHYLPAMPVLHDFLIAQGRLKYVMPLYKALLAQADWGVDMAKKTYAEARPGYHQITRASVEKLMP
ncbi:M1 family metallopeptidase [Asticcacaulis sp. EMRT-3]|uniref:M1 family metallopeptidase n=1 Tax=Asticcacaulis sp. EMRT-3 TaxID=3040349 RepID=UPI0024AFAE7B|nr:M1 family metallopeptidase [Asticcacaulis sp. EMRT-3]MDI7775608.1 M1 family metallopeptidase [Asticcacaulis sp. EMRT-3]